jgi:hypothetical protein
MSDLGRLLDAWQTYGPGSDHCEVCKLKREIEEALQKDDDKFFLRLATEIRKRRSRSELRKVLPPLPIASISLPEYPKSTSEKLRWVFKSLCLNSETPFTENDVMEKAIEMFPDLKPLTERHRRRLRAQCRALIFTRSAARQ